MSQTLLCSLALRPTQRNFVALAFFSAVACIASSASANLLTNAGFEVSSWTGAGNVLGNFPGWQGVWGPEVGVITGPSGGVSPAAGSNMLELNDDGLSYTQAFQTVDVTSFSGLINSGTATVNASALFNTVGGFTGALAIVNVSFFSGSTYGSLISASPNGALFLDANPQTWQSASTSSLIPVGTTWMMYQVAFNNASMGGNPGFVDNTDLTITPAPGAIALLGLAGFLGRRRRD